MSSKKWIPFCVWHTTHTHTHTHKVNCNMNYPTYAIWIGVELFSVGFQRIFHTNDLTLLGYSLAMRIEIQRKLYLYPYIWINFDTFTNYILLLNFNKLNYEFLFFSQIKLQTSFFIIKIFPKDSNCGLFSYDVDLRLKKTWVYLLEKWRSRFDSPQITLHDLIY